MWKPIESAPKDGTYIDVWVKATWYGEGTRKNEDARTADVCWRDGHWADDYTREFGWNEKSRLDGDNGYTKFEVTHWMPMPHPPEST